MARTIAQIQAQMDAAQALQPSLSGLDSVSQTAIYTLWKFIMSTAIFIAETLWEALKVEIEADIASQRIGSDKWVKDRVDEFQYSLFIPQVLTIVDNIAAYDPIDTDLQIISRSAVETTGSGVVTIKAATGEPPVKLDAAQKTSLEGYLDSISFAGVNPTLISLDSDKMFIEAEIFFNGQFVTTISSDVIAAITAYMTGLDFDTQKPTGKVNVERLTDAIQAVTGVLDVVITGLAMRADTEAFASKTFLVQAKALILRQRDTAAGYIVEEDEVGENFSDKLTFTPST